MQKYYDSEKLGTLVESIPECGEVSVDLSQLFKHATGLKFLKHLITPENIESMCVYGSVLYKHFPNEKQIIHKTKKYMFFGPEKQFIKTIKKSRKLPNDFDVMVITKQGFTEDKVITPIKHLESDFAFGYSLDYEVIDFTAVETKKMVPTSYGYSEDIGGANLHITYRSAEQFLTGLGDGDELSESVLKYGLPIIGQNKFAEIIKNITSPKRGPLHKIEWEENFEGRLEGKII